MEPTQQLYDLSGYKPELMRRYTKEMLQQGARFYARISIANFIDDEPERVFDPGPILTPDVLDELFKK